MMNKRRIEITVLERKRMIIRPSPLTCPVCHLGTELLTPRQAGALAQVKVRSIYRWLAQGKVHGVKTPGGQHRVCKDSLFYPQSSRTIPETTLEAL
jgi:hypothetical protein